jgi:WD40 repeat protein
VGTRAEGHGFPMNATLGRNRLVALFVLVVSLGWARGENPTDQDGFPLPERAVCRLGSSRFLHADTVIATAFSPDGKRFASASIDGQGVVWEWPSGKALHKIPGGDLRFSPNSQFLAVWRKDRWNVVDVRTGATVLAGRATALPVFSTRNDRIAWTAEPNRVGVQELSQTSKSRFLHSSHTVKALAFDAEGDVLAAEMQGQDISVRNLNRGKEVRHFDLGGQEAEWAALTSGARRLAFSTKRGRVSVFDLRTGKPCFPASQVPADFEPRALREDGKLLLLGGRIAFLGLLWDLERARAVSPLTGGCAETGAFTPKGDLLATGGRNSPHAPLFWDTKTGQYLDLFPGHHAHVLCVAFSPDGKEAATCTFLRDDLFVRLWDTATGKQLRKLEAFPTGASRVAFSPDGKRVVACGWWGKRDASVWEAGTFKKVLDVKGHHFGAQLLALSSDGKKLATVGSMTTPDDVIVWDLETGKALARHSKLGKSSQHVVFLPGDRTLALGDLGLREGSIHLWDWETNRERTLKAPGSNMAFSPDGWLVAVADQSGTKLIEVLTGAEVWSAPAVTGRFARGSLAFAPDGRAIAVGSGTGLVHLFDWSKEDPGLSFRGCDAGPYHMAFSRDGSRLAGVDNATALIWDVGDVVGRPPEKRAKVSTEDLEAWCRSLSSTDARAGYRAVWKLVAAGDDAVAVLKRQLRPARTDAKQIARWVADLDDDDFATREKAALELTKLGEVARGPLEAALKSPRSLEQRRRLKSIYAGLNTVPPARVLQVRSLLVLEQVGSPSAREVLAGLAKGDADAFLTQQAQLALRRLGR